MANLVISGDTSGSVTLAAPAVSGTTVLTLPTTTGTLVVTGGAQTIEFADGTVSAPSITNSGDTNTGIYFPAADTIAFTEGGVESMRIDSSGNLGLGVTPSAWGSSKALQINTYSSFYGTGFVTGTAFNSYFNGTNNIYLTSNPATSYLLTSNGEHRWFNAPSGTAGNAITFTQAMTLDSSGNVGIGTSSPNSAAVDKALTISGTANSILELNYGSTRAGYLYSNSSVTVLSAVGANSLLRFNTEDTEKMVITNTGNVGIGTSSPAYKLSVNGRFSYSTGIGEGADLTLSSNGTAIRHAVSATWTSQEFYTGGSERMRIDSSGNLCVGTTAPGTNQSNIFKRTTSAVWPLTLDGNNRGLLVVQSASSGIAAYFTTSTSTVAGEISVSGSSTSYVTSSDYRLKENIVPMIGALDKVSQLKPVTYNWKTDGSNGEGFIAHELAEVCPLAVCGEKDAVDEEGSIKPQGIDTSFLVATLTAAIQELNAKVTALEKQLGAK
jgi:hypothetical protein